MTSSLRDILEKSEYIQWLPLEYRLACTIGIAAATLFCFAVFLIVRRRPKDPKKQVLQTEPVHENQPQTPEPQTSWQDRLKFGLTKTRSQLSQNLSSLFKGKEIDSNLLESLNQVLFRADIGVNTADYLTELVKKEYQSHPEPPTWSEVKVFLETAITSILSPTAESGQPQAETQVVLIVGVNGVGKTTSIGKLASHHLEKDKKVLLGAADTYRAAAVDQLKVWGERLGVEVIAHKAGSDPAAVAFDSVKAAISRQADILFIDTAGRLHNKKELMAELEKIKRVIAKDLPEAPHETWLVIDATTGQNAFQQIRAFKEVVKLTGLIVTKLDGTAKGGVIIGASQEFQLPIKYIGIGEKADDLREFRPKEFAQSLFE